MPKSPKPYSEKLKDPRWQKKRLETLKRDNFTCCDCYSTDKELHVHHRWYEKGLEPWDYDSMALVTLCDECHRARTLIDDRLKKETGFLPAWAADILVDLLVCARIKYGRSTPIVQLLASEILLPNLEMKSEDQIQLQINYARSIRESVCENEKSNSESSS